MRYDVWFSCYSESATDGPQFRRLCLYVLPSTPWPYLGFRLVHRVQATGKI